MLRKNIKPRILASIILKIGHPCNTNSLHKSRGNSLQKQILQMDMIPCAMCSPMCRVLCYSYAMLSTTAHPLFRYIRDGLS
jgi:hypothetical protein